MFPSIVWTAIFAAIVIAILAYIADFFVEKAGFGVPRQIIWLIALAAWLFWVFGGGARMY